MPMFQRFEFCAECGCILEHDQSYVNYSEQRICPTCWDEIPTEDETPAGHFAIEVDERFLSEYAHFGISELGEYLRKRADFDQYYKLTREDAV